MPSTGPSIRQRRSRDSPRGRPPRRCIRLRSLARDPGVRGRFQAMSDFLSRFSQPAAQTHQLGCLHRDPIRPRLALASLARAAGEPGRGDRPMGVLFPRRIACQAQNSICIPNLYPEATRAGSALLASSLTLLDRRTLSGRAGRRMAAKARQIAPRAGIGHVAERWAGARRSRRGEVSVFRQAASLTERRAASRLSNVSLEIH